MITDVEASEILQVIKVLPPDKVTEVRDFVNFLHSQYLQSQTLDESDEWSEEDLRDFTAASRFAEMSIE